MRKEKVTTPQTTSKNNDPKPANHLENPKITLRTEKTQIL